MVSLARTRGPARPARVGWGRWETRARSARALMATGVVMTAVGLAGVGASTLGDRPGDGGETARLTEQVVDSKPTSFELGMLAASREASAAAHLVRIADLDVVGLRGVGPDQIDELRARLPGYRFRSGPRSMLGWRDHAFERVGGGSFASGSISWVRLEHRAAGRTLVLVDASHLPRAAALAAVRREAGRPSSATRLSGARRFVVLVADPSGSGSTAGWVIGTGAVTVHAGDGPHTVRADGERLRRLQVTLGPRRT